MSRSFLEMEMDVFGSVDGLHCGGYQRWFDETKYQKQGCGVVAAANITAYLARSNPEKYSSLYTLGDLSKESFTKHMNRILEYVRPGRVLPGFWFAGDFARALVKFAKDRSMALTSHMINRWTHPSYHSAADFIRTGINQNAPAAMIIHWNINVDYKRKPGISGGKSFMFHWVTVIGIEESNAEYIVSVSSWGKQYRLSLKDAWRGSYAALVYVY